MWFVRLVIECQYHGPVEPSCVTFDCRTRAMLWNYSWLRVKKQQRLSASNLCTPTPIRCLSNAGRMRNGVVNQRPCHEDRNTRINDLTLQMHTHDSQRQISVGIVCTAHTRIQTHLTVNTRMHEYTRSIVYYTHIPVYRCCHEPLQVQVLGKMSSHA